MQTPSATHSAGARRQGGWSGRLRRILLRKLWLPRIVYEALPYFYVVLGLAALASALYAPGWAWILPYLVLLGLACLHAGLGIVTLRYRFRRRQEGPLPSSRDSG